MHIFESPSGRMAYEIMDDNQKDTALPTLIWSHGWGQSRHAMRPLAQTLRTLGRHILIDAPGFGDSPVPFDTVEKSWSSREYADFMADFIREISPQSPVIWIGHSFGCRIATQLGAHYPELIAKMVYIAGAGLKRRRSPWHSLVVKTKIYTYKMGKKLAPFLAPLLGDKQFGSTDYRNAGPMRGTLVKVVNENLEAEAAQITAPVLLLYGTNDTETPPEIGTRFEKLIKNAQMIPLSGQDHYTVLSEGHQQTAACIKKFLQTS